MKKTIFGLALLVATQSGCAAGEHLHVKGNMEHVGDTLLALTEATQGNPQTVVVKNNAFEFDFPLSQVSTLYLVSPGVLKGQRGTQIAVVAVPGETLELTGDVQTRYDITGSRFYQDYHVADLAMEAVQNEQSALSERCMEMMRNGAPQDSVRQVWESENGTLEQKLETTIMDFIKQNAASEAAAAVIPQLPPAKMRDAVALLSDEVRNGRMKPYYEGAIHAIEAQQKAEEEAAKLQAAGREAPDFTLNDLNGKPLALSSLRGRYVVLDFWGSWCGWCIKGFPQMKEYYSKYKGKFEILGIDCNDPEAKWKDAVKKHELPWLHVYNPRSSTVLADYGIQGFPTKIVVDPQGRIARTVVGEDPAFYTYLDELFGGNK